MGNYRKLYVILCTVGVLSACDTAPKQNKVTDLSSDTAKITFGQGYREKPAQVEAAEYIDLVENEIEVYYVVIADTGLSYYNLRNRMFLLQQEIKNPIDTMGRGYSEAKNLIALPDEDEDEIYRGQYFPRRFPSNTLSLEYLNSYNKAASDKTIALVAGIYERKNSADSALGYVRKYIKEAFTLKAEIYVGCIH